MTVRCRCLVVQHGIMKKKFSILFLLFVLLLALSEFFFLREVYEGKFSLILILTALGVAVSIFFIVRIIRKYNA